MNVYIEIINDIDYLFKSYNVIKVDDDNFLIADAISNTDSIYNPDDTIKLESVDLDKILITENNEVFITLSEFGVINKSGYILRLYNISNSTFGHIKIKGDDFPSRLERESIVNTLALMHKDIRNVTFKFKLVYDCVDTLVYIREIDNE